MAFFAETCAENRDKHALASTRNCKIARACLSLTTIAHRKAGKKRQRPIDHPKVAMALRQKTRERAVRLDHTPTIIHQMLP